ncbi:MAG: CPBP family intramembrane glutamic endopeptidase [Flavobacteriaceae bacterium]|nr:CPBP family intramembrane glutamic endopeptidase [Flavobacteriaceae bacterium]
MIGNLIILVASYFIFRLFSSKNLFRVWVLPWKQRLSEFTLGILFFGLIHFLIISLDSFIREGSWTYTFTGTEKILQSFWYHINSALFEEMIFRGVILHFLIFKLGIRWAIFITSIAFGVYHWFTYGIFGNNIVLMIFVLLITGTMGGVWAYSYYRTKSIILAFGLHLGWNFVTTLFTESTPYGSLIFQIQNLQPLNNEWVNLIYELTKGLLPAYLCYIFIKYYTRTYPKWKALFA